MQPRSPRFVLVSISYHNAVVADAKGFSEEATISYLLEAATNDAPEASATGGPTSGGSGQDGRPGSLRERTKVPHRPGPAGGESGHDGRGPIPAANITRLKAPLSGWPTIMCPGRQLLFFATKHVAG
jgi:hypothetical protein